MSKLSVRFLQKTSTLVKVASQSNFHFTHIALVLTHILITSMKNIVLLILWKKIFLLWFSLFYWKRFCSTYIGLNLFKLNCSNMVWNCSNWWSKLFEIDLNLFLIRFVMIGVSWFYQKNFTKKLILIFTLFKNWPVCATL